LLAKKRMVKKLVRRPFVIGRSLPTLAFVPGAPEADLPSRF